MQHGGEMRQKSHWMLQVNNRSITLNQASYLIGRSNTNDVVINDGTVSRAHATLTATTDGWLLTDFSSANGTYVDGRKIHQITLQKNCCLTFGECSATLYRPSVFSALWRDSPLAFRMIALGAASALSLFSMAFSWKHAYTLVSPYLLNDSTNYSWSDSPQKNPSTLLSGLPQADTNENKQDFESIPDFSLPDVTNTGNKKSQMLTRRSSDHHGLHKFINNIDSNEQQLNLFSLEQQLAATIQTHQVSSGERKKLHAEFLLKIMERIQWNRHHRRWDESPELIELGYQLSKTVDSTHRQRFVWLMMEEALLFEARRLPDISVAILQPLVDEQMPAAILLTLHLDRVFWKYSHINLADILNKSTLSLKQYDDYSGVYGLYALMWFYLRGPVEPPFEVFFKKSDLAKAQYYYDRLRVHHHWLSKYVWLDLCDHLHFDKDSTPITIPFKINCPGFGNDLYWRKELAQAIPHPRAVEILVGYYVSRRFDESHPKFIDIMKVADNYGEMYAHRFLAKQQGRRPVYHFNYKKWGITEKKYAPKDIFKSSCKEEFGNSARMVSWREISNFADNEPYRLSILANQVGMVGFTNGQVAVTYERKTTTNSWAHDSYLIGLSFGRDSLSTRPYHHVKTNKANNLILGYNGTKKHLLCVKDTPISRQFSWPIDVNWQHLMSGLEQ